MTELELVDLRGGLTESRHRIDLAVVDAGGRWIAGNRRGGDPVFWRSAAKPFQLWPLIHRGGAERFRLSEAMLALACGSHNAEPVHRELAAAWLQAIGLEPSDLACGGHPSLSPAVAAEMIRQDVVPGPLWSNCSGKHAGLLALAVLEGWPTAGYERWGHPVQEAVAEAIARWTDLVPSALAWGIDGCTAAAVATPLDRLALAWARLGADPDPSLRRIREAMMHHPELVAGSDRLDTVLMQSLPGRIVVKVGAEGVYAAALPSVGVGVALKIEDGDMRAAAIALVSVLERLLPAIAPSLNLPLEPLARWHEPILRNTRGEPTGQTILQGEIPLA